MYNIEKLIIGIKILIEYFLLNPFCINFKVVSEKTIVIKPQIKIKVLYLK